ncbi:MAG: hypothetical protein JWN18_565 [Parcubacteria group bacterium]|nr:hypothetical protein [Parcubacteria group bacterium]
MPDSKKATFTWREKRGALARHLAPHKNTILILSLGEILMAVGNGLIPYITGKFFDSLVTPHTVALHVLGVIPAWQVILATWAIFQILILGINTVFDRKERLLRTQLEAQVPISAFAHLLTLPVSFHKKQRVGEITENVNRSGWMLSAIMNATLSTAPQFLTIIIGLIVTLTIYPALSLVLLSGIGVYALVLLRIIPKTTYYQEEGMGAWNRLMGDAQDAYANFVTVKHAGAEFYENNKIATEFKERTLPLWLRMENVWSNLNQIQRIVVATTQAAILFFSVFLVSDGKITIGDLIAFNTYAGMIIGPFVRIGGQWQTIQNGLIALARADKIFKTPSEVYEPSGSSRFTDLEGNVTFDKVHFTYESDQPEVLKGVSFAAKAGEVIAFVGETGVGKSTTVDLISGYYFPSQGTVTIDGQKSTDINLIDLRRNIAIVPQEVVLFNASISENIRYGRPEATDEMVRDAARKAHADGFIEKFPRQYDQEVGERGIKLSVGQKQRVAIARAILRNPRILILDEPTSALDAETEQYISKSFDELMKGRTTFIVAHRLSTVRKADKILVLKDGQIAEQGNHAELMARESGLYRKLYELHIGLHE